MSPGNSLDRTTPPPSQELSLPDQPSSIQAPQDGAASRKERRNPSITPRKFNRFFTPRSLRSSDATSSRRALHEINGLANSRAVNQSSPIRAPRVVSGQENTPTTFTRDLKRRKLYHTPEASPDYSQVEGKRQDTGFGVLQDVESNEGHEDIPSSPCERVPRGMRGIPEETAQEPLQNILQMEEQGLGAQLLQLRIHAAPTSRRQYLSYPVNDWRDETAAFCSRPEDVHVTNSLESPYGRVIPFCATGCNTNSLVAVGDEEGRVRLLDPDQHSKSPFAGIYIGFRVHTNAIIDMAFSEDDSILATASGDQTSRIVDMTTQTTFSVLAHHSASLKQVRFMPGSNSILATSSRDGGVKIWDLRCKGDAGPKHHFYSHVPNGPATTHSAARLPTWGRPVRSINDTHRYQYYSHQGQPVSGSDLPSRGEIPGRTGDMSVTAISFLPEGREHLLLTASEADASVKLWDIRSISSKRRGHIALSQTKQPESHSQFRHFGISSINVNEAGTRLYTLCKDNTVYAYSTAHLILGHAPDLSIDDSGRRFAPRETKEGLGPIHGFRHPQFHATSFYVKSAIRKAKDGKSEMLAVGSSDGCAVLFPTDERYLSAQTSPAITQDLQSARSAQSTLGNPGLRRAGGGLTSKVEDGILRSTNGTALIRGHDREVGSLCWTHDGELITLGDDYFVRCWRENGNAARDLRVKGEGEGRRFACGWADVEEEYDEEDD